MIPTNRYSSYMLRLQWTQNGIRPTWVVSMQSTKTGEQRWFPNLDALIHFLQEEYNSEGSGDAGEPAQGAPATGGENQGVP